MAERPDPGRAEQAAGNRLHQLIPPEYIPFMETSKRAILFLILWVQAGRYSRRPVLQAAIVFIGIALGITSGCARTEPVPEKTEPVHVVVYLVDTLRADRVGAYGYPRAQTPVIDQLAKDGVLFENCYAPGPWTVPSTMSLHTSLYPNDHGVVVDGNKIPPGVMPMAARMKAAGYWTAGYICNPWAGVAVGLEQGYDIYVKKRSFVRHDLVERGISTDTISSTIFSLKTWPWALQAKT